jgi:Tfp pilus assembly protein FimT
MEMLLVLSILVLAATIAFPALNRLYLEHKLQEAAQVIQSRLATARVHALDEGVPYQFLFELNGPRFLIIPEEPDAQATAGSGSGSAALVEVIQARWKFTGNVEQGIIFEAAPSTLGTGHVDQAWLTGLADADKLDDVVWATPISFYPDGTSSGGEVQVADTRDEFVRITIRALTGGVLVSPIERKGRL